MEVTKKLFTVDEYYRMAEAGIIESEDRVELIDGEVLRMSPLGNRHLACSHRATTLWTEALGRRVIVSVQNPLRLDTYNEPQPDIIILMPRPDFYASGHPGPRDASLVIEISDSSLNFDRNVKVPHYSQCGVPEVWIEDLKHDELLVYRDPEGNAYRTLLTFRKGDTVSPLAFPDIFFKVDDILG